MVKSLKTLITEQKNVHMEHIEDILFDEGVAGARRAINFMQGMRDMLAGKSPGKVNATVNGMVLLLYLQEPILEMEKSLLLKKVSLIKILKFITHLPMLKKIPLAIFKRSY